MSFGLNISIDDQSDRENNLKKFNLLKDEDINYVQPKQIKVDLKGVVYTNGREDRQRKYGETV